MFMCCVFLNIENNIHPCFRQFTNKYYKHREVGVYKCIVCGVDQFSSKTKYDSGSGWPSFYDVVDKQNIKCKKDASAGKKNRPSSREKAVYRLRLKAGY